MLRKQILSALNDLRKICTDLALGHTIKAIKSKKPESTVVEESKKEPEGDGRAYERGDYAGSANSFYQHRGSGRHRNTD